MSKERLEEIEGKYTILPVSSKQDGFEYTEVVVEDLVFLIQNGFKQAERVQELEEESYNAHLERLLDRKEQQNKRYRKKIEVALDMSKKGSRDDIRVSNMQYVLNEALEESS